MRRLRLLSLLLFTTVSCGGEKDKEYFFEGEFAYYADAAIFLDCSTGEIFPVVMSGDYLAVEKGYKEFNPTEGEKIMCQIRGYIKDKPKEEEGRPKQLYVTKLIGFKKGEGCDPDAIIAGKYRNDKGGFLSLNSDYSYELQFDKKTEFGVWGHTDNDKIELTDSEISGSVNKRTMKLLLDNVIYWSVN